MDGKALSTEKGTAAGWLSREDTHADNHLGVLRQYGRPVSESESPQSGFVSRQTKIAYEIAYE